GTVRRAGAREQQAQVVVDLRDRSDGGARIVAGGLLLDGDRGRQAVDGIDVGLFHEAEELARIGRERLDVSALALGVDGVEREGRFAGARQPRDDREAVAGNGYVHVAQ